LAKRQDVFDEWPFELDVVLLPDLMEEFGNFAYASVPSPIWNEHFLVGVMRLYVKHTRGRLSAEILSKQREKTVVGR
jgi:hypothetical protein